MKNISRLGIFLISISGVVTLYFTGCFLWSFLNFSALSSSEKATIHEWRIKDIDQKKYLIEAKFSFSTKKGEVFAHTVFDQEYLNKGSAISALKSISKKDFTAWYDPKSEENATIEKKMPINLGLRSFLSIIVFIYFLFLLNYNSKRVS